MDLYCYRELLWELSRLARLPDPHRFIETGLLRIEGLDVRLSHEERVKPAMLGIKIDLGPAPDVDREALWRALLVDNIGRGAQASCAFSLHPREDRIVMVARHRLTRDLSARMLSETLHRTVQQARSNLASALECVPTK